MIAFAICGSFCTLKYSMEMLSSVKEKYGNVLPIMSENVFTTDTRFGTAEGFIKETEKICGREVIHTINDAEPIGPLLKPEVMIICPCTGNTLAKLANGITDTSVTMAAKAHLRNNRPLVISLATNDALSSNLVNIGKLLQKKNVYFVPMVQDDIIKKPHSLVAQLDMLVRTVEYAKEGQQMQPIFLGNKE